MVAHKKAVIMNDVGIDHLVDLFKIIMFQHVVTKHVSAGHHAIADVRIAKRLEDTFPIQE